MNDDEIFVACRMCGYEFETEATRPYDLCGSCGCEKGHNQTSCYLEDGHDGPCRFTPYVPVTDKEVAETLASIGQALR